MSDFEEEVTFEQQFVYFAKMLEPKVRSGNTIDLERADYWMRQAGVLNDRGVTTTDTGILFFRLNKSEINYEEFEELVRDLADSKGLSVDDVMSALTNCGTPGSTPVHVPQYRDYFLTWQPKNNKSEINYDEFLEFLEDLCQLKDLDLEKLQETLTNCGIPGASAVFVPRYRDFFDTYKPKEKMLF